MRHYHPRVNMNKNSHVHLLPITDIQGVISDNNFSLLLNVLFRLPNNIFSQNEITEIHTNANLILMPNRLESIQKQKKIEESKTLKF